MNKQKIERAAKVTDKLWANFQKAQECLRTFNVNGFGVLADRALLRNDMLAAKKALEAALQELDSFLLWPSDEDYGD
ncbi:hypothetical protein [Mesorhizobium sp.]|uniref:hypothetical protein n=1 Tax=Mesorhizobium sp. TaxID=1871066 RepID=UPI000FE7EB7D|nr:hypothetical protein [Mesorhizobium sp.]RWI96069.1 MAG: hypothetical protein EOR21_08550 [Mesorhizobium sp.]